MKQMYHFHLHLVVLVNKFSYVHPPCTEPVVCLNVTMYNDPLQQQRQQSLSSKSFSQPRNLPGICEIVYFYIYVIVLLCGNQRQRSLGNKSQPGKLPKQYNCLQ